jgi:hypothetical protein
MQETYSNIAIMIDFMVLLIQKLNRFSLFGSFHFLLGTQKYALHFIYA